MKKQSQNKPNFFLPKSARLPLLSTQNPVKYPALAVGFAVLVHINSALCLLYYLNCLWYLLQFRDFEWSAASQAFYPSVGGAAIEQPIVATSWALGNNLHQ